MIRKNWLEKAEVPIKPKALPSSFADWVYRASHGNKKNDVSDDSRIKQRLNLGKIDESLIERFKMYQWTQNFLNIDERTKSDWRPVFIDDGSWKRTGEGVPYKASSLSVKGKPLLCVPDAVLENAKDGRILIIERKTTRTPEPKIPKNGWPNVEAQLWCYSWIDDFLDAEEVLLVGQLWHCTSFKRAKSLCLRHPAWRRSDQEHHARCLKWFEKYGGEFREDLKKT